METIGYNGNDQLPTSQEGARQMAIRISWVGHKILRVCVLVRMEKGVR